MTYEVNGKFVMTFERKKEVEDINARIARGTPLKSERVI